MFIEIVIIDERRRAERLSDALLAAGALSASIEDADAGSADEQPIYGEPGELGPDGAGDGWRRSRVVALFDGAGIDDDSDDDSDDDAVDSMVRRALDAVGIVEAPPLERREIADADWVALTQSQFEPVAIGGRLWVVPSWHEPPAEALAHDSIVLRLDPGMAFGTGEHPTTRLCLAWLVEHVEGGERVIDYGCGSGILAIAAAKLGAGTVVGTDIDEQAITAARANAAGNGVAVAFTSSTDFASPPAQIVVANILSNPLKVLAPLLTSLVAPDGRLVLSGVLERQAAEVAAIYASRIALDVWRVDEGWVCLVGRRRREPRPIDRS